MALNEMKVLKVISPSYGIFETLIQNFHLKWTIWDQANVDAD